MGTLYSTKIGRISQMLVLKRQSQLARKNDTRFFLCTGRSLSEIQKYLNYDVDGFILGVAAWFMRMEKESMIIQLHKRDVSRIKQILKAKFRILLRKELQVLTAQKLREYLFEIFFWW